MASDEETKKPKKKGFAKVKVSEEVEEETEVEAEEEDRPVIKKKEKVKKAPEPSEITPEDDEVDLPQGGTARVFPPPSDEEVETAGTEPRRKKPLTEIVDLDFESSKLHNSELEFYSLLQVILDKDLQATLWPRFVEEHFASETTVAIFKRLTGLLKIGKEWPGLLALSRDPALTSGARSMLSSVVERINQTGGWHDGKVMVAGNMVSVAETSDYTGYIFDVLDALRMTREGLEHMVSTVKAIHDDEEFDPLTGPTTIEGGATKALNIRSKESIDDYLLNFGAFTSSAQDLKREKELNSLFNKEADRIKTGFLNFDNRAGGILPGEVVLVGANSGGGKTALMLSLMVNMARLGFPTAMLQLELTLGQLNERLSGNLAEIDTKILRKGIIPDRAQKKVRKAWAEFHEELAAIDSRVTIFAPSAANVAQCEMYFKQFPYKVWFIDYVNLLEEASGSEGDGWMKLSAIVKKYKALAKKYNVAIILAVQVNVDKETGEISVRYAQGMKEHADIVWLWNLTKEARNDGVVWINNIKARQFEPFDWQVKVELKYARFASLLGPDDVEPQPDTRKMSNKRHIASDDDNVLKPIVPEEEDEEMNTLAPPPKEVKPVVAKTKKEQPAAPPKFQPKAPPPEEVSAMFLGEDDDD